MNTAMATSDVIKDKILGMGADDVSVTIRDNTMYVAFYRARNCGKIHKNACNFLEAHFGDNNLIVVIPQPQPNRESKAYLHTPGSDGFIETSILAAPSILGV